MTNLLLRLFLKNADDPTSAKNRAAVGRLSGWMGIVCNLLLCTGKFLAGLFSGSVAIMADAMNNLSDASSSIVTLIGFRLAEKPADEDHPYGHARFEYLSGLAVSAFIVVIGFELAKTSLGKIFSPEPAVFSPAAILILLLSIAVKLWMYLINTRLGKQIQSTTLLAAAADSRNDCIATFAVLAAAALEHFTHWRIDGFMGLAVSLFILYSGACLAKETISPLLGEAASPELQQLILDNISTCPQVLGYHDLMVHDYGPGQRFASIHVEMDHREDPMTCHEIIDDLERECWNSHRIHLVIHYDPVITDDPELNRMREVTEKILYNMDPRMTTHDFRMVRGNNHINLIFDVALPADIWHMKKEIRQTLPEILSRLENTTVHTVIFFDPTAFNSMPPE